MYGERIQMLRKQHRMSRAALGELCGVSSTAVYKWENNLSQPDLQTVLKLADLFGVSVDDLCDHVAGAVSANAPSAETMVARAIRRMSPTEQETYLNLGKLLFAHAFSGVIPEEDPYGPDEG